MIIDKVLTHHLDKSILRNIKNAKILYKHNENKYIVCVPSSDTTSEVVFPVKRDHFFQNVIRSIISPENYQSKPSKKIVLDFSSPNIAKPFHAGHLRSTIIGNFIANVNSYFNNKVTKINYLGDWGTQFGLLQYGLKEKNINVSNLKKDSIKTLFNVYVFANKQAATNENVMQEARKYFADIEQGKASLESWKNIRAATVQELETVYQRLGIKFDEYHWESDYNGQSISGLMQSLEEQKIIMTEETGKKIAKINDRDVTILKSDSSTLYISRDIAALLDRYKKYEFDKMLYIVDNSQADHFAAVFDVVRRINPKCVVGCEHIKFGRIKGMSSRTGNVIFLNDILDEAKRKMHEKQSSSKNTRSTAMTEETCDILGTSAVLINDLKQKRQKDYSFDWDRALQSEGDSGIKLQYLHCRLWSLEKNCGVAIPDVFDPNYLPEEIVGEVISELAKFESILQRSLEENEACILVGYLFRLAKYVNRMFNELKVKNENIDLAAQRLLVFYSARLVVERGLKLLGVKPLQEM